jgi:hypothetical protein
MVLSAYSGWLGRAVGILGRHVDWMRRDRSVIGEVYAEDCIDGREEH